MIRRATSGRNSATALPIGSVARAIATRLSARSPIGLPAWDIDVSQCAGADGPKDRGVVEHALPLVALGDQDRVEHVKNPALERQIRHPVIVRILVRQGRNQKCAEELAHHLLGQRDTGILGESGKARTIGSVRVAPDTDRRFASDGQQIERIADVFLRQNELIFRGERKGL